MLCDNSSNKNAIRFAFTILLGLNAADAAIAGNTSQQYKLKTLYSFCPNGSCEEGAPPGDLAIGPDGNLYGTTSAGGAHTWGTLFRLSRGSHGWKYDVLYSFCKKTNCADGGVPNGHLIFDNAGNIFGTTTGGGASLGLVFELSPPAGTKKAWTERVLYAFKTDVRPANGLTYPGAASGEPYDGVSPVYGSTNVGGVNFGGTVYEVTPTEPSKKWSGKTLYSFCSQKNCVDGEYPTQSGSLALGQDGNIYGTTSVGGANDDGVAFMLSSNSGQWSETVLHDFGAGRNDGANPHANMILDQAGNLYGTATFGGENLSGVIFKIAAHEKGSNYSVIYDFCSKASCVDGQNPYGVLSIDASGNLIGSTRQGGAKGTGTVFEMSDGLQVLRNFCLKSNCADGDYPLAEVTIDRSGNLFSTTSHGGVNNDDQGTAFELSP